MDKKINIISIVQALIEAELGTDDEKS